MTRKTVARPLSAVVVTVTERELGHLVDGRPHVLVGDAHELALDDDVADHEQAARLDLLQRAEREQHRRLHLDGEDAAVRPALVLPVVGVVEDVARDDRADAHLLAELLRVVHGAVDELPVGGRRVRLAADSASAVESAARAETATIRSPIVRSGWRPPQVPTRRILFTPSWASSSITIAADGQPIPVDCTDTGLPPNVPV